MQSKYLISLFFVLFQLLTVYAAPLNEKRTSSNSIPKKYVHYNTYFLKPDNWGNKVYAYVYTDNKEIIDDIVVGPELLEWPGTELYHSEDFEYTKNLYYYNFPVAFYEGADCYIIFTDGKNQAPGVMKQGFLLKDINQVFTEEGYVGLPRELLYNRKDGRFHYEKMLKIIYRPIEESTKEQLLEQDVYTHYQIGGREWTELPGELMYVEEDDDGKAYYAQYFLAYEDEDVLTVTFTNGNNVWDNNNGQNYVFRTAQIENVDMQSNVKFY